MLFSEYPLELFVMAAIIILFSIALVAILVFVAAHMKNTNQKLEKLQGELASINKSAGDDMGERVAEDTSESGEKTAEEKSSPVPRKSVEPFVEDAGTSRAIEDKSVNPNHAASFARQRSGSTVSEDVFIQNLKELIDKKLSDPELSVPMLAAELCVSRSGLFAKVKEATGDTPNNMINEARLQKATLLLEEGKHHINEICYLVGFSSPSYFTRSFDKRFGMTPHQWMDSKKKA